jgi:hypothetical protein
MRPLVALLALAAALPAALGAEPWNKVDELPGGIAVEIDEGTEVEALDGVRLIERATFRRELPNGTMETAVAVDCAKEEARIRGVRLMNGEQVLSENVNDTTPYTAVHPGSAEAIYFKALCDKDISGASTPGTVAPPDGEAGE